MTSKRLEVQGLVRHFGGVKAVDGVDFSLVAGECVALIGPNGAGKSTCFACLAGQQVPTAGKVQWGGQSLLGLSPSERLLIGVGRTFQVAQVFEALSVLENVQLALRARQQQLSPWQPLRHQQVEQASALLERADLLALADSEVGRLSYGAKKRLELALALAGDPQLLLLDEPAAGLAGEERAQLMQWVRSLASSGMAVLYTEHNMDAVAGIADRVLVLIEGRLAAEGSFEDIARNPVVQSRYLGQSGLAFLGSGHA